MKGQMFILTMVFLVGLIFSVQSLLLSYNYIDLSQAPQTTDANVLRAVSAAIKDTVMRTESCSDVSGNLDEFSMGISTGMLAIYDIRISYNIYCDRWNNPYPNPPPIEADINITGEMTETSAILSFYHNVTG